MSTQSVKPAPTNVGPDDGGALGSSETAFWLRRWVAVAVAVVTILTVFTAYADEMPYEHHSVVPALTVIIAGAWAVELAGVRWSRLVLVAANVVPNVAMALIGHSSANYLFLGLLVVWVGLVGSRVERVAALVLSLATIGVALAVDATDGQIVWANWVSWSTSIVILWLMARVLSRQQRLVTDLRALRSEAEKRNAELEALLVENARLHERARQAAVLEERQRLARELHDSVTQALYGVSLQAEAASRALADGDAAPVATSVQEIRETTQEALGEMRLLLFELRPPLLEERGLLGAIETRLRAVEARAGLLTELEGDSAERLEPETEQELYRLAQEALNNVLKHAHAGKVSVRLDVSDERAVLEVSDDGVGFEPGLRGGDGFGLPGMRERAERLGGALQVESSPGAGTRVRVEVPR